MKTITLNTAIFDLQGVISNVISNQEQTVIATDLGSVIIISEKNWESISETLKLLKDKKSLKALLEGHSVRKKGKSVKGKSPEEIFYDL